MFRIYRDTRFSRDKTPYKTYLGIFFWEGGRKKMENSGFYFHLTPTRLMLAVGMHTFPRPLLQVYRDAVVHPQHGPELVRAVERVSTDPRYEIGGQHYKRIPRGYDPDHKNAKWLLHNGLYAHAEGEIPEELNTDEFLDFCLERFTAMAPIHRWLVQVMAED